MQAVVGALRVILGLDSAAFEKGADAAEKKARHFAKRMEALGQGLTSFGQSLSVSVTLPLVGFGTKAVAAAMDAQKAAASVDQALATMGNRAGFTSEQLQGMAAQLEKASTFDGDDILSKVTANLLTFGNVQGDVFERAQVAALDLSARLGQDLQSSAIQLGKALNDPVKGLTALSRVGVSFTEQQREQIKAMTAAGNVAGAQAVILAELERQYGGQAAAMAATDAGKLQQAYIALGNAMEAVGAAIIPVLVDLSRYVTAATEAFQQFAPETQQFIVAAGVLAAAIGPLAFVIGNVITALSALIKIAPAVRAAMVLMTGPIGIIVTALAAAAVAIYTYWDEIKAAFETARTVIVAAATAIYEGVKEWLGNKLTAIFDWVNQKIATVKQTFADLYDAVVGNSYIPDMVEGIGHWMGKLPEVLVRPSQQASDAAKHAFSSIATSLVDVVKGTRSARDVILDMVDDISRSLLQAGINSLGNALFGGAMPAFAGGFAGGGTIPAGRFGLVGERGPELIAAGRSPLTVYPNEAFGSGGGTVYNIDARGSNMSEAQFRAILADHQRQTLAMVPATVRGARRRGMI